MSNDNQTTLIQCAGCQAKLRISVKARGKTVACPKCGQQMMLKEQATVKPPPTPTLIAATPVTQAAARSNKVVVAKPISAIPPVNNQQANNQPTDIWQSEAIAPADLSYQPYSAANSGSAYQPFASTPTAQSSRKKSNLWIWLTVGAGLAMFLVVGVGAFFLMLAAGKTLEDSNTIIAGANSAGTNSTGTNSASPSSPRVPSTAGSAGSNLASSPKIPLPGLGPTIPFGPDIMLHRVEIGRPGQPSLSLNVFIPKGTHADHALPVMLEAPSGTNLLHGANVEYPFPDREYLPFTEMAGMITVSFSISGFMPRSLEPSTGELYWLTLGRTYKEFVAADAGVVDGSLAIDWVLDKLPAADPKRIYVWGHSSSATLSLLLASKDRRIAKCISLAPITDLNSRLGELLTDSAVPEILPDLKNYFRSGSPTTYVNQLKCPVFLAHARDDDNEPFRHTQRYVQSLRQAGGNITFLDLPTGGHYQSLIDVSIPQAIEWLE